MSNKKGRTYKKKAKVFSKAQTKEIKKIAIQEQPSLIHRQFHGVLDNPTGEDVFTTQEEITQRGNIYELTNIQKSDINQPINISPPDGQGGTVGMLTRPLDGFRSSEYIKVKGISIELRMTNDALEIGDNAFGKTTLYLAIVSVNDEDIIQMIPGYFANQLHEIPRFGYSPKLDPELLNISKDIKKRTLWSQKLTTTLNNVVKQTNKQWYIKFPTPIPVQYTEDDQNGMQFFKNRLYLVIRSDIPSNPPFDHYRPAINLCYKTHYIDS